MLFPFTKIPQLAGALPPIIGLLRLILGVMFAGTEAVNFTLFVPISVVSLYVSQ